MVQHQFTGIEFKYLRGGISITALENVLEQIKRAKFVGIDASSCGCANRRTHGLPCAHEIAEYQRDGRPIPLDSIDPHWKKLEFSFTAEKPQPEIGCQVEIDMFLHYFNNQDNETKLQLKKKLREMVCPSTTHLHEPIEVKHRTRGRPKKKIDTSTRRDPSGFEYALSGQDSYSPAPTVIAIPPFVASSQKRPKKFNVL